MQRQFTVIRANQVWVTDITYILTWQGWLYLAVVIDLFARNVMDWSMKPTLSRELALDALMMAVWRRRKPESEVIVHSDQGIATGATNPRGVKVVINFDGDRGAIDGKSLCDKTGLMKSYAQYGKTAKLPSLWLYAENDKSFPPDIGREMFNAYQQSKSPAHFIVMPPYGKDVHVFMDSAPESFWWNTIATFLEQYHQPFQEIIKLPVVNLIEPLGLNAAGKKSFSEYEATQRYEKAFATDPDGDWGAVYWARNNQEAASTALNICTKQQRKGAPKCTLYAINNNYASEITH